MQGFSCVVESVLCSIECVCHCKVTQLAIVSLLDGALAASKLLQKEFLILARTA